MILSLAPMEGLTGYIFRTAHAQCFGPLDHYYTPFLPAARVGEPFFKRYRKEIDPENNRGLHVIPQLMTKNAEDFVWSANILAELGYSEVNLNLGCPSGTVVAKGKGAGLLRDPQSMEAFLRDVCEQSPLPVSAKTRIGILRDEEYVQILEAYACCHLSELIVHPRVQADKYSGKPRWTAYGDTIERAPFPVAYNGDLFTVQDLEALVAAHPKTRHVMIGRGILTNPALARMMNGGPAATAQELERFHDVLFASYQSVMEGNALPRMKEWWFYARYAFADPLAVYRAVRKQRGVNEYACAVKRIFQEQVLAETPRFNPKPHA